jgi:hypothetical protein
MYMEMLQGNYLCCYLEQTKMSFFLFYKFGEQEGRTDPIWEFGNCGRREEVGKEHGRVNMVQILCMHVCKWKNDTC